MRSSLKNIELKSSLVPSYSPLLSNVLQDSIERSNSSFANISSQICSVTKKAKKLLLKIPTKNNFINNNQTKPMSPTSISLKFLKRQDPFYKKFLNVGEQELLEVQKSL